MQLQLIKKKAGITACADDKKYAVKLNSKELKSTWGSLWGLLRTHS